MKTNPYRVLKLKQTASKREIVQAKAIAMKERAFSLHEIAQAEKCLLDPQKRIVADFLLPYVRKVKPYLSIDIEDIQPQHEAEVTHIELVSELLLCKETKPYCESSYFYSLILPDVEKILERSLDDLLAPVVLDEGSQIFIQEEETLWQNFLEELKQIRNKYSIPESSKLSVNIFPDDLGMKFLRVFSVVFNPISLFFSLFGLVVGGIFFILRIIADIILPSLSLGNNINFIYFHGFLPVLGIICFIFILPGFFIKDEVQQKVEYLGIRKPIFSKSICAYWKKETDLGCNFKAYKLFTKLYPTAYVKEVKQARERLNKRINNLIETREQKIQSFMKQLSLDSLTCKYVSRLSNCERLLLLKAFKEKSEEAKQKKQTEKFASILREIGGVKLLEILLK